MESKKRTNRLLLSVFFLFVLFVSHDAHAALIYAWGEPWYSNPVYSSVGGGYFGIDCDAFGGNDEVTAIDAPVTKLDGTPSARACLGGVCSDAQTITSTAFPAATTTFTFSTVKPRCMAGATTTFWINVSGGRVHQFYSHTPTTSQNQCSLYGTGGSSCPSYNTVAIGIYGNVFVEPEYTTTTTTPTTTEYVLSDELTSAVDRLSLVSMYGLGFLLLAAFGTIFLTIIR